MVAVSTHRLILKDLAKEDVNDLFEVRGDPDVMAFWDWPPDTSLAATATVVDQMLRDVASGQARFWTVRLRSDHSFVGLCDFSELEPGRSADIGFLFVRRYWGLGLAHDAVGCILEHARTLCLKSVRARVHRGNERSERLLRRAGFTAVEAIPQFEIRPGVYRDCERFEILL